MMTPLDESPRRQAKRASWPGQPLITRDEFIADLSGALARGHGYAAGKIGNSEKHFLYYPLHVRDQPDRVKQSAFRLATLNHFSMMGLFPRSAAFLDEYAEFYADRTRALDAIGLFLNPVRMEHEIVTRHALPARPMYFRDQEPGRTVPDDPSGCYLPLFRGRRLLLVCPFAGLLQERATRETFEAVWRNTGKRWFEPASVDALEFPYGFLPATQRAYPTVLDLYEDITTRMRAYDFDVALIAAGGIGIPLAAFAKQLGKVAISLGGHLQMLFGVRGRRWRDSPAWASTYYNDAWIDMPAERIPPDAESCDRGSYW